MRHVDTRRYDMLLRVRAFGHAHRALFPSPTVAGRALAEIVAAVEDVKEHAAGHESCRSSAREALVSKAAARTRLRHDVDAILRTARAMNLEAPGTGDRFLRPIGTSDLALLNAARALARDAAALAETFALYNLPGDFLEVLERDIAAFDEARLHRTAGIGAHVAARVALETTMVHAMRAVRLLDAAVPNQLRGNLQTLAAWTRARRVAPAPAPRRRAAAAQSVVASQVPAATADLDETLGTSEQPSRARPYRTVAIARGIRELVARDWAAARQNQERYRGERISRLGASEGFRVAEELRRRMLRRDPGLGPRA